MIDPKRIPAEEGGRMTDPPRIPAKGEAGT